MAWLSGLSTGTYIHRRVVVFDWDEHSVRVLDARPSKGGIAAAAAVEEPFPHDLDMGDGEAVGRFVNEVRERAGIAPGPGVTALGADAVGCHVMQLPPAPEAELWPMALMQARREQNLDNMAVDFCVLPPPGATLRVLACSVADETMNRTRAILRGAQCPAAAVGFRPQAALRVRKECGPYPPLSLFVDVRRSHTEITVLAEGAPAMFRSVPVGTETRVGDDEPGPSGATWVHMLVAELRRTLFAHSGAALPEEPPAVDIACSELDAEPLAGELKQAGFAPRLLPAGNHVEASHPVLARLAHGNHFAALGAARQYLLDRDFPLDFEHPKIVETERRTRESARVRKLALAFAALVCLLLPSPIWYLRTREVAELREELDSVDRREKKARKDTDKYKAFRDVWSDRREGTVDPSIAPDVNAERALVKARREELEKAKAEREARRRFEGPYRIVEGELRDAERSLRSMNAKQPAKRRIDVAAALEEVFAACESAFQSERGGGRRGRIVEFRLDAQGTADARGRYPIQMKCVAESSAVAQELVFGLMHPIWPYGFGLAKESADFAFAGLAKPQAELSREGAVTNPRDAMRVEFDIQFRPLLAGDYVPPTEPGRR